MFELRVTLKQTVQRKDATEFAAAASVNVWLQIDFTAIVIGARLSTDPPLHVSMRGHSHHNQKICLCLRVCSVRHPVFALAEGRTH